MKTTFYVIRFRNGGGFSKNADGEFFSLPDFTVDDVPHYATARAAFARLSQSKRTDWYEVGRVDREFIPTKLQLKPGPKWKLNASKPCVIVSALHETFFKDSSGTDAVVDTLADATIFSDLSSALVVLNRRPTVWCHFPEVRNVEQVETEPVDTLTVIE